MIARQAPQFTLRPGPGLALIEDLRRLRDWYLDLCRHREIIADDAAKQNNLRIGINGFEVVTHKGTRYNVIPGESGAAIDDYELKPDNLFVSLPPTLAASNNGTFYNTPGTPPAPPANRAPYTLPRPAGLVRKREVLDFQEWALAQPTDHVPNRPAVTGLATRADLIALAEQLAAG